MPSPARSRTKSIQWACVHCGKPGESGVSLSTRGICAECAEDAVTRHAREMAAKSGPAYDKWRRAMAAKAARYADQVA